MKNTFYLLVLVLTLSNCSVRKARNEITLTGKIEKIGMTTFQYGTHILHTETKTYALKSSTMDLNNFLDVPVKIEGKKVSGYPIENGPDLIEVSKVSK